MITLTLAPAALPPGQRIYAIGDVHGCDDRLAVLHQLIAADLAARPVADALLLHLGDYIDRGEASAAVLQRLSRPRPAPFPRIINLMGNHEAMMLSALDSEDPEAVMQWLANGGAETLASWGLSRRSRPREWARAVPPEHVAFLRGLPLYHAAGGYVFVHAGLRPGVPLERQSRHDLLWIREPFLSWQGDSPFVVVHGHTPEHDVVVRTNRIGIDTGAVMGGVLTCVALEGDRMGFLRA